MHLEHGASQRVNFVITPDMMKLVNDDGKSVLNSGDIKIEIAGSEPSKRSASKPVESVLIVE